MKRLLCASLCLVATSHLFAQEWMGYHTSNYAGINAVQYNPALITETNYGKYDISIIAANVHAENNYLFLNSNTITNPQNTFSHPDFQHVYIRQNLDGFKKDAIVNANIQSPAFLYQVTPKDAIGFCARGRVFVNADKVDQNLAQLVYEGLDYPLNWDRFVENEFMNVSANAWMEYDFSYAHVFKINERYKLKAGITFKLLQGLGAAGAGFNNYRYNFYNDDTLGLFDTHVQFGTNNSVYNQQFTFDFNAPGFAFDVGFTYEYTPNGVYGNGLVRQRRRSRVKWPKIFTPDETKYKWKLGISFNDLGAIFYKRAPQTQNFYVNQDSIPLSAFDGVNSVSDLTNRFNTLFVQEGNEEDMTFVMPMHINMFGDVKFRHNFGLHSNLVIGFNQGNATAFKNHFLYQLTLTPRWEIKWFGVYMPFWISQYFNPNLGISLRLGPLVIGTGDLLGHLIKREYSSIDVHMALRLIIPHSKKRGTKGNAKKNGKVGGKEYINSRPDVCPAYNK